MNVFLLVLRGLIGDALLDDRARVTPFNLVPEAVGSKDEPLVVLGQLKHLNVGLR